MITSDRTVDQVSAEILAECREDHVGLWEIVSSLRAAAHSGDRPTRRGDAMRVVQVLLDEGVSAGFPASDGRGFVPWSLSKEEIVQRIEQEWDRLGREPTIGDIVWFTTTE